MSQDLKKLSDYATLKKLANALWQHEAHYHGAAVMVGAGFSRCAARTSDTSKKLPLWSDLSAAIAQELGSSNTSDPLRLAEEYSAYFGKQALFDLAKREINDSSWTPGTMHTELLELPWSDILTTNWDTLLERAATEIHSPIYNVVSRQEELSRVRAPRVVKLHGTIGTSNDLIFSQEDYRRYPQRHAAFVNFARQVFIENELCLLGFSGDDPNFLQWVGWVRDQLATHARRIYIAGALSLTATKRRYLEFLNIAAIDLSPIVAEHDNRDDQHRAATQAFLLALRELKPTPTWDWTPTSFMRQTVSTHDLEKTTSDQNHAARMLERQIPTLQSDRQAYPGWVICPIQKRWEIKTQINDPYPTQKNLAAMEQDSKEKLLYEMAWRHSIVNEPTPEWLAKEFLDICTRMPSDVVPGKQKAELALRVLKSTRWYDATDETKFLRENSVAFLSNSSERQPELNSELRYYEAISARDNLDYSNLANLTDKVIAHDPIWNLRKAALLAELGKFEEGENLIAEAHRELLTQARRERHSIYVESRLAWARWVLHGVYSFSPEKQPPQAPRSDHERRCDPWDHIENLRRRTSEKLEKQREQQVEPEFEPGHYRDHSRISQFSSQLHPILLLDDIATNVGVPLRWDGVSFLGEHAARIAEMDDLDNIQRNSLAIRVATSEAHATLKRVFSRIRIACLPQEEAENLIDTCMNAIHYWRSRLMAGSIAEKRFSLDRLRVFLEVLARMSVRASAIKAQEIFLLSCTLGRQHECQHSWLATPLEHLTRYSLRSIPYDQHKNILLEALLFPLQSEIEMHDRDEWPNPIIRHPGHRTHHPAIDRRVDEIIETISPSPNRGTPALLRLLPLIESGYLTKQEQSKIADRLWGHEPIYQSLPSVGLLSHAFLALPSRDPTKVKSLVRKQLYSYDSSGMPDATKLTDIANAALTRGDKQLPSEAEAVALFEQLITWRASASTDPFGFNQSTERRICKAIGRAFAHAIIPALPSYELTSARFEKLHNFLVQNDSPQTIIAIAICAAKNKIHAPRALKSITSGLQTGDSSKVANSAHAVLAWARENRSKEVELLIPKLMHLTSFGRSAGLPAVLWTINELYNDGLLPDSEIVAIRELLPVIFDNSDYNATPSYSEQSIDISLIRSTCVKFALDILQNEKETLMELQRITEEALQDPLPEVRILEPSRN